MRWIPLVVLVGSLLGAPSLGWSGNACVECHRALPASPQQAHSFSEWQQSPHASAAVTCEACHGGNPQAANQAAAHHGLTNPRNKESPLFFSRIPETCGRCHSAELTEFRKSFHYQELQRSGHGPNCTTCHGTMAVNILPPQQMEQLCSVCHKARPMAIEALVAINLAGASLKQWESLADQAAARKLLTAQEHALLKQLRTDYAAVQRRWHAFDMNAVLSAARTITTQAKHASQALALKLGVVPQ